MGRNWKRPRRWSVLLREFFLVGVPQQVADIQHIREVWGGDVVVTDPAMVGPFLVLSELDRVQVVLCSYAGGCTLPGPDAPPLGLGLPLPHNWRERTRNQMAGWLADVFLSDIRRRASLLRQQYGPPLLEGSIVSLAARLPLLSASELSGTRL